MNNQRIQRLLEMLLEEPNDSFLLYALATEYLKLHDNQKALFYYLETVNSNEEYVGVYYHLAKLYEALNENERALATYQKVMKIARKIGDNHAFSELQSAFNIFNGLDYENE
jgi:tetratricopeptide (TPR) repeat protein